MPSQTRRRVVSLNVDGVGPSEEVDVSGASNVILYVKRSNPDRSCIVYVEASPIEFGTAAGDEWYSVGSESFYSGPTIEAFPMPEWLYGHNAKNTMRRIRFTTNQATADTDIHVEMIRVIA